MVAEIESWLDIVCVYVFPPVCSYVKKVLPERKRKRTHSHTYKVVWKWFEKEHINWIVPQNHIRNSLSYSTVSSSLPLNRFYHRTLNKFNLQLAET